MTKVGDVIRLTFEEDETGYEIEEFPEERGAKFGAQFQGEYVSLGLTGWIDEQKLEIYTHYPNSVPENKKVDVAESMIRINSSIWFGSFEMDFLSGAICVRTNIPLIDGSPSTSLVKTILYKNLHLANDFYPILMKVIYGNTTPEEALIDLGLDMKPVDANSIIC